MRTTSFLSMLLLLFACSPKGPLKEKPGSLPAAPDSPEELFGADIPERAAPSAALSPLCARQRGGIYQNKFPDLPFTITRGVDVLGRMESAAPYRGVGFGLLPVSTKTSPSRFEEPSFGSCLARATTRGYFHYYARHSALNADGTILLLKRASSLPGGAGTFLLRVDTYGEPPAQNEVTQDARSSSLGAEPVTDKNEPRWDSLDPNALYFIKSSGGQKRFVRFKFSMSSDGKLTRRSITSLFDFEAGVDWGKAGCGEVKEVSLGKGEGRSSAGGRYWGFQVTTSLSCTMGDTKNQSTKHLLVLDARARRAYLRTLPKGTPMPDSSSVSLSGKWLLARFPSCASPVPDPAQVTDAEPCGIVSYPSHLGSGPTLLVARPNHWDTALSASRRDVIVVFATGTRSNFIRQVDIEAPLVDPTKTDRYNFNLADTSLSCTDETPGCVYKHKSKEGMITRCLPGKDGCPSCREHPERCKLLSAHYHISGNNWAHPGWVLVSEYTGKGGVGFFGDKPNNTILLKGKPLSDPPQILPHENAHYFNREIFALQLDSDTPALIHLAHHRTAQSPGDKEGYYTEEAHASVSYDFTRVVFHSNWLGPKAPDDARASEEGISTYVIELPAPPKAPPTRSSLGEER